MRILAWRNPPAAADVECELEDILGGIEILTTADAEGDEIEYLRWWLAEKQLAAGDFESAAETATGLNINTAEQLELALLLVREGVGEELLQGLATQLPALASTDLANIVSSVNVNVILRLQAAHLLLELEGSEWEGVREYALDLFTSTGDAPRLAATLSQLDSAGDEHPYMTLLVSHLLPADAEPSLVEWCLDERRKALDALPTATAGGSLSELSRCLVKLLDGGSVDLAEVHERLDVDGLQAFRQCRRALMDGGDGLVSDERLEALRMSVSGATLTSLERNLFDILVGTLQLNRSAFLLQDTSTERNERGAEVLESLLSSGEPRLRYIISARELVLEHGIAVPALVRWYQEYDPTSAWHTVAKASLFEAEGERVHAAHALRQAAAHPMFDFETSVLLLRRALISFAHSSRWMDAIEMLESQPALCSALTRRFQLYLRVCDDASRQAADAARERLLDAVRNSGLNVTQESEENEGRDEMLRAAEELELLMNYPLDHGLPTEPFQGRVRAALRHLQKGRRSNRSNLEWDYRRAQQDGTIEEIHSISTRAAEEQPEQGLMMLERAMGCGRFRPLELQALQRAQQSMFSEHQKLIPVRRRRNLRNLSLTPLVLVDTNLLIDALKDRIALLLDLDGSAPLSTGTSRGFHRVLLMRSRDQRVHLFLPAAVLNEIGNWTRERAHDELFRDVYVDEQQWENAITPKVFKSIIVELQSDFSTWKAPKTGGFNEAVQNNRTDLNEFLQQHASLYEELTHLKADRGEVKRTELEDGRDIYPEAGDIDIMLVAAHLAENSLLGVGSILVASRDGDFTLVWRALEERFGFGVVKNAQMLARWMN
jgi:hypothetical protein